MAAGLEGPGWLAPFLRWEVGTFAVAKLPGIRWRVRPAKMLKKKLWTEEAKLEFICTTMVSLGQKELVKLLQIMIPIYLEHQFIDVILI